MSARYLLRLDDACPTMDLAKWDRLESLLDEHDALPLVAVTPDNQDPALVKGPPDPAFWERVRRWRDKGWTIAMHGYQHALHPTTAKMLLPFYPHSEFAGLPLDRQSDKIRAAWAIFQAEGLAPDAWVAPAHCFDRITLAALAAETPIRVVSDGIARRPFVEDGFQWLPQQLWRLVPKRSGVWTVCLHPNAMDDSDFDALRNALSGDYRARIASVREMLPVSRRKSPVDRMESAWFWQRHRLQQWRGRLKRWRRG